MFVILDGMMIDVPLAQVLNDQSGTVLSNNGALASTSGEYVLQ